MKGSGGDLVSGKSSVGLDLVAGDRLGFFVVPDGFSQKGMANLLDDAKGGWKFVDAKGNPGNVDGGKELKLVLYRETEGEPHGSVDQPAPRQILRFAAAQRSPRHE